MSPSSRLTWIPTLALVAGASSAAARPAFSPLLPGGPAGAPTGVTSLDQTAEGPVIELFLAGAIPDAELAAHGVVIGSRLPDGTRTARVPLARLGELRELPGLTRVAAAYRCEAYNNASVPTTNATPGHWVHNGAGAFSGNAGAGVIVGVVDSGIDWSHDDFRRPNGTSRILSLWDQNVAGVPPAGFSYGAEWNTAQINAGACLHHDTDGHGTHVIGTAAGDGSATANGQPAYQFTGMAPKADIVAVATNFSTVGVVDGVNYIFQKAAAAGKDAVVNLSLGMQFGAHDGTDPFDTALDQLTGPGKIIVAAAGNEGNSDRHAEQVVAPGPAQTITFNIPTYIANGGASNDYVIIDAYYPAGDNLTVTLTSPSPTPVTVGPVVLGAFASNPASFSGSIYIENGFTPSPSGDHNVFIQIYDQNAARPPRQGTWTITLTPVNTQATTELDAWLARFGLGSAGAAATFTSDVDESELVSSPGSASQIITAGAYITKGSWPAIDGSSYHFPGYTNVGALAGFSNPGPLRNGALKPDIAAPGSAIVSTLSSFAGAPPAPLLNPDGRHYTEAGTSMAAPHVAGACALWLADAPHQTPAELKARLAAEALVDAQTGGVPNPHWGFGKLRLLPPPDHTPPVVTALAPNGGESWPAGAVRAITWIATDAAGVTAVDLYYSSDGGSVWKPVTLATANDGAFDWTVPDDPTASARIKVVAHDGAGNAGEDQSDGLFVISNASGVAEPAVPPTRPIVFQNEPNPCNPTTRIRFGLPEAGPVRLTLFSAGGRRVRRLLAGTYPAGFSEATWDGRTDAGGPAPSGVYYYLFEAAGVRQTRRLVLSQ